MCLSDNIRVGQLTYCFIRRTSRSTDSRHNHEKKNLNRRQTSLINVYFLWFLSNSYSKFHFSHSSRNFPIRREIPGEKNNGLDSCQNHGSQYDRSVWEFGTRSGNVYISLPLFDYFNLFCFAYLLDNNLVNVAINYIIGTKNEMSKNAALSTVRGNSLLSITWMTIGL